MDNVRIVTILKLFVLASALIGVSCTFEDTDADRLASLIESEIGKMQSGELGQAEIRFQPTVSPALVVLIPGTGSTTDLPSAISSDDLTLLNQIRSRRHNGASTLSIITENGWSSVDYIDKIARIAKPQAINVQASDSLLVQLIRDASGIKLEISAAGERVP